MWKYEQTIAEVRERLVILETWRGKGLCEGARGQSNLSLEVHKWQAK